VPNAYANYVDIFLEELAGILPSSSDYDYTIELDGKVPLYLLIYNLLKRELDLLKEYLDGAL